MMTVSNKFRVSAILPLMLPAGYCQKLQFILFAELSGLIGFTEPEPTASSNCSSKMLVGSKIWECKLGDRARELSKVTGCSARIKHSPAIEKRAHQFHYLGQPGAITSGRVYASLSLTSVTFDAIPIRPPLETMPPRKGDL